MPQGNPRPGEKYLHFKNKMYQIVAIGKHSETDERMVVYQALYGEFGVFIRPYDMFIGEVDHEKYPQITQKFRFQYVEDEVQKKADRTDMIKNAEAEAEHTEEGQANPWLMKFLDAENFEEKYKVVSEMYSELDDKLIDDLAVCLDVVIPEGKLQDRYLQLKQCIRTRQKYEGCRI